MGKRSMASYGYSPFDHRPLEGVLFRWRWSFDGDRLRMTIVVVPHSTAIAERTRGTKRAYAPRPRVFTEGQRHRVGCWCGWRGRKPFIARAYGACPSCAAALVHISTIKQQAAAAA